MKRMGMVLLAVGLGCGLNARAGYNEDYSSRFGAGAGKDIVRESEDLGVHWGRLPANVSLDFFTNMFLTHMLLDSTLTNYQAHGVVGYGVINPARDGSSNWPTPAQFAAIVSNLVERYDGDGVYDMPGLEYPVRVWELVNEYSSVEPDAPYPYAGLGRTNFIEMIKQGRQAIKAACPAALFAYDPFDKYDTQALFLQMNPSNVDIVSYHTYSPLDAPFNPSNINYLGNLAAYKQSLGLTNQPVWATEYACYEHEGFTPPNVAGTQADNARWYVQTTIWSLGSGLLDKIIYAEIEPPPENYAYLQWMALTDANGTPRQIYYAYKKLAALIDRYSSKQTLSLGADIYGFQFTANATNVYVLWSKGGTGTHTNVALTGLTGTSATVIVSVPDTNGQFETATKMITDGQLVFEAVSEIPVYVMVNPLVPAPAEPDLVGADYDGDGKADPAVYVETASSAGSGQVGTWYIKLSASGYGLVTLSFGGPGYSACEGDYDGDGKADPAVYQAQSGLLRALLSSQSYAPAQLILQSSAFSLQPAPGDYDGDGKTDPAIYNAISGDWQVAMSSLGYGFVSVSGFGGAGYEAVAGDYDGDGKTDPAVYNTTNGNWAVLLSASSYIAGALGGFGGAGYVPVSGDFDGDGRADPAIYEASTGTWSVKQSGSGYAAATLADFGGSGNTPLAADFDGDGRADPALFETATGKWHIKLSANGYATVSADSGYTPRRLSDP